MDNPIRERQVIIANDVDGNMLDQMFDINGHKMMKAGNIVHLRNYSEGYDDAKIESISTHSETGYEFTHPIAMIVTMDGEFIGSYMEHDFEMKDGELWELGD